MKEHSEFSGLFIVDHPLVQHKLSHLREKSCPHYEFKPLLKEISLLMGYAMTEHFPLIIKKIETPLVEMDAPFLMEEEPVIVPILRAGLGMAEALQHLMPRSAYGHIGLYRDEETHRPVEYLIRLPEAKGRRFIITDPMLATGYSARHATDILIRHGVPEDKIILMTLVAAPEGVRAVRELYKKIHIYTASLDSHLNEKAYIVPGLGDAGDRIFGTN
jgi:uracil phosphoribosyltransferase